MLVPQPPTTASTSGATGDNKSLRAETAAAADSPRKAADASSRSPSRLLFQRSQSAPTNRFDAKRHQAFLLQLRNTLLQAETDAPPTEIDAKEAHRRIDLLKKMIADTERMGMEARVQNELEHDQRYCAAERRRLEREAQLAKKLAASDSKHDAFYRAQCDDIAMLHRHRHRILSNRTERCVEHNEANLAEILRRGAESSERRDRHLCRLEERREAAVHHHASILLQREQHAAAVLAKKRAAEEEEYQQKLLQYEAHRAASVARQVAAVEQREKEASVRRKKAEQSLAKGRVARVSVSIDHGQAIMQVMEKPFEVRLAEAATKERRRQNRADEEHQMRSEYARFRAIRSADRRTAQEARLDEIVATRLKHCEDIQLNSARKAAAAEAAQAKLRDTWEAAGSKKTDDVLEHQRRAAEQEEHRQNKIRMAKYLKWSSHTDTVAEKLLSEYVALATEAVKREGESVDSSGRSPRPPTARTVRSEGALAATTTTTTTTIPASPRRPSRPESESGATAGVAPRPLALRDRALAPQVSRAKGPHQQAAILSADRRHETVNAALRADRT